MGILTFEKPKKLVPTVVHNNMYSSEAIASGTYVPNMSETDMKAWKAKKISGNDSRIEIRKTIVGCDPTMKSSMWGGVTKKDKNNCSAQILVIVRPDRSVVMSANGRMAFDKISWDQLQQSVNESINYFDK